MTMTNNHVLFFFESSFNSFLPPTFDRHCLWHERLTFSKKQCVQVPLGFCIPPFGGAQSNFLIIFILSKLLFHRCQLRRLRLGLGRSTERVGRRQSSRR